MLHIYLPNKYIDLKAIWKMGTVASELPRIYTGKIQKKLSSCQSHQHEWASTGRLLNRPLCVLLAFF